jgi:hypothetical protein
MNKIITISISFFISFNCFAQKTVISYSEYLLRIEKNWTEDYAVSKAKEKAKINAIENAFGTVITQGNAIYINEINTSSQTKSDMVFTSVGNVLVNGEWISTIDEKIQFKDSADFRWVKAL